MDEKTVCNRCGYEGLGDALYCAHCGHRLVPLNLRVKRSGNRILSNLSSFHIGILGLILSVPISFFAGYLIVTELSFPFSLVPLALVIGCGYTYVGWHLHSPLSNRTLLRQVLFTFACMGILLVLVWLVDRGLLSLLSDRTHLVIYEIPGIYRESSPGFRRLSIDSNLSYWLIAMIYGVLAFLAGNLVHRGLSASRHEQH
jgi:hypothetical protein